MILIPDDEPPQAADPVLRFERFAVPYYLFVDSGVEVVLASPAGGSPALAPAAPAGPIAELARRFRSDGAVRDAVNDTLSLDQVDAADFEGAFCIGVPGPIWREAGSSSAAAMIARFLAAGKPVAVIPSKVDSAPRGSDDGLLIVGESPHAPLGAARALLAVLAG